MQPLAAHGRRVGAEHQDRYRVEIRERSQPLQDGLPRQVRQVQVEQDDVRTHVLRELQPLCPGAGGVEDNPAPALQQPGHQQDVGGLVLHVEQRQHKPAPHALRFDWLLRQPPGTS